MSEARQTGPEGARAAGASESAPSDRATTFQPVQGDAREHYSGEVLLVTAYALLWAILVAWIAFLWRRQRVLAGRLTDLERVIADAATRGARARE